MKTYTIRLKPNQDLKEELEIFVKENNISAGCVVTCVGSLKKAVIRLAEEEVIELDEKFEIVSLVGTLSKEGCHLHISLADKEGRVIGGHLKSGNIIYTTAEIVICELDYNFSREFDEETGFKELVVNN